MNPFWAPGACGDPRCWGCHPERAAAYWREAAAQYERNGFGAVAARALERAERYQRAAGAGGVLIELALLCRAL